MALLICLGHVTLIYKRTKRTQYNNVFQLLFYEKELTVKEVYRSICGQYNHQSDSSIYRIVARFQLRGLEETQRREKFSPSGRSY